MLYDTLMQRLREFFVDVTDDNVVFHLGDLFDPSQFRLCDVFLKTEVLNALHLPFELKAGYVGDVKIEGFVGFVVGSPLTISVADVCLVVGHKPVDWSNELAWRYAKELLVAILHSVAGSYCVSLGGSQDGKKDPKAASTSSDFAKWVMSKIQSTIAESTIKLDRLHIRFESDYEGQLVAYGVRIPTLELSTRDVNDQILSRREQPGVKYPSASTETTASKRLYLANAALYCELQATSFLGVSPSSLPAVTTPTLSTPRRSSVPEHPSTTTERHAFMRQRCAEPFEPGADRDLVLISAVWLKLDFLRTGTKAGLLSWVLGAVDLVTEEIKVNGDLMQLAFLTEELARVADFFERTQRRAWLPSWADRDQVAPPRVTLSLTSILPVISEDILPLLSIDSSPRRLNSAWLLGMWRYAARCVLMARRTDARKRIRLALFPDDANWQVDDASRERYIALYTRSLSDDAIKIALFGRVLGSSSPRATDVRRKQQAAASLPVYEPLNLTEQWELSDLVQKVSVRQQTEMRQHTTRLLRLEYASPRSNGLSAVPIPTDGSSHRSLFLQLPQRRGSTGVGTEPNVSPNHVHSLPLATLPADFIANHHQQFTRSRAESSPAGSPTKQHSLSPPSPTTHHQSQLHPQPQVAFVHSASAPVDRVHKTEGFSSSANTSPTKPLISFREPLSPTAFARQKGFIETLLPKCLLDPPSRVVPLINWHVGPLSLHLHHRVAKPDESAANVNSSSPGSPASTPSSIPPRSSETFMELHVDGCTGCALLCKSPAVSFLVELRFGLVKLALVDIASLSSTGNAISTEYIREPGDGFLYLGLKYNFHPRLPSSLPTTAVEEQSWDIKAKLCVGTIRIEYNDMALQSALRVSHRRGTFGGDKEIPVAPSIRLDSANHVTIIRDVLQNWKSFVQRVEPRGNKSYPKPTTPAKGDRQKSMFAAQQDMVNSQQLLKAAKQAQLTKLLNALMLQSSCIEVDMCGMELTLSMLTSNVVERVQLRKGDSSSSSSSFSAQPLDLSAVTSPRTVPLPLFDSEQVQVTLPAASAGLQNRPLLNECKVHGVGASIEFRTTKQGRAAVIDHVMRRIFPLEDS